METYSRNRLILFAAMQPLGNMGNPTAQAQCGRVSLWTSRYGGTDGTENQKAKSLCRVSVEICGQFVRVMSSFDSALCCRCLLLKAVRLCFLLCALCVLLWESALAATYYVDMNSTNATPPYTNWTTAATNIQDAVDAAVAGDEVVVTNGVYYPLRVNNPLNVRSVNGPQLTTINGQGGGRCAYLTNGASLCGFTLTNGFTYDGGGGVRCESASAVVSNCVISGNLNWNYVFGGYESYGGGAYGGTLNNCTLTGNSAGGDAQIGAWVNAFGGGAAYCILNNCTLSGNSASGTFTFASAGEPTYGHGGGAYACTLFNCTLSGNSVAGTGIPIGDPRWPQGGGAYQSSLNNCIVYFNRAEVGGGIYEFDYAYSGLNHCWTGDPFFVYTNGWADLRLQSNSPCINAGNNAFAPAGPDLDGNPRIVGGTVDIGAYEFQTPVSKISYAWLQYYGLPINASTDTADPDGDGVDNYHEWLAGTDPTNRFSSPAQLTIVPSGVPPSGIILTWSTNAVGFALQSATDLTSAALWTTNLPAPVIINGQNVVTNPISGPQQFYRLVH
jgi:hypothetical protein